MFYKTLGEKVDGYGSDVLCKILDLHAFKKKGYYIKVNNSANKKNAVFNDFLNFKKFNEIIPPKCTETFEKREVDIEHYYSTNLIEQIRTHMDIKPYDKTLNYPNKINIGVHIRRGDVFYRSTKNNTYRDKYYKNTKKYGYKPTLKRRYIELSRYVDIMKYLNSQLSETKVLFHVFSVGEYSEFLELECITNKIMYIETPTYQETYFKNKSENSVKELIATMINSDILLCSKSSLSQSCAMLTRNITIFPIWTLAHPKKKTYYSKWIKFDKVNNIINNDKFKKLNVD